jgi:tetratricopeptide (TPR) repeat protein
MRFLFLFCWLLIAGSVYAQPIDEAALLKILSNRSEGLLRQGDSTLLTIYTRSDSAARVQLLNFFDRNSTSNNRVVAVRSLAWKGVILFRPPFNQPDAGRWLQQAVNRSVESGDIRVMIQCFELYGDHYFSSSNPEIALFYYLKSAELRQQLNSDCFYFQNVQHFGRLGELLYAMQEYKEALPWLRMTVSMRSSSGHSHTSVMNSLGLAYQQMGRYDSALYWYNRSIETARAHRDTVWEAIATGNTGWLYFEKQEDDIALPLLWKDYHINKDNEKQNAANTLHRIALIYLRRNKPDSALLLAKKGLAIIKGTNVVNTRFLRNAYYAVSTIYRRLGPPDSAFFMVIYSTNSTIR